jgi:hypothetical protein
MIVINHGFNCYVRCVLNYQSDLCFIMAETIN